MKRRLILVTLLAVVAVMLGVPLVATIVGQARAAALLDMGGQKILVMTADEYTTAIKRAHDEARRVKCDIL